MSFSKLRDQKFWTELRQRTSLDGRVGIEECSQWCRDALELLPEGHQFRRIEGIVSSNVVGRYSLFINRHLVLARRYSEGIFIADGTAGQILERFLEGYYGYVSNAPEPLASFYRQAVRSANPKL